MKQERIHHFEDILELAVIAEDKKAAARAHIALSALYRLSVRRAHARAVVRTARERADVRSRQAPASALQQAFDFAFEGAAQ